MRLRRRGGGTKKKKGPFLPRGKFSPRREVGKSLWGPPRGFTLGDPREEDPGEPSPCMISCFGAAEEIGVQEIL